MAARRVERCGHCGGGLVLTKHGRGCPACRTLDIRLPVPLDPGTAIVLSREIVHGWRDVVGDLRIRQELSAPTTRAAFIESLSFVRSLGNSIQH